MTTTAADSRLDTLRPGALAAVEASIRERGAISRWLDTNRVTIEMLLQDYTTNQLAHALGMKVSTLNTWRERRGLMVEKTAYHAARAGETRPLSGWVQNYDVSLIHDNPWQPRQSMDADELVGLAESIYTSGLLQTPTGRSMESGGVQLAFGHRRVAAIKLLIEQGKWNGTTVPIVIRPLTDREMAVFAFEENRKRTDISPLDELMGYRKVIEDGLLTIQDMADTLGMARPTLSNRLRLLKLPQMLLDRFGERVLSAGAMSEFLCMVGEDHTHEEVITWVVRNIESGMEYRVPDWTARHVRSLIGECVRSIQAQSWRPLERDSNNHHYTAPTFDVEAFVKEFPTQVYAIPDFSGSTRYTSNVKEWQKRQSAATREANKAFNDGKTTQQRHVENRDLKALEGALQRDPVLEAIRAGETLDAAPVQIRTEASEPEDGKGQAYRDLNDWLEEQIPDLADYLQVEEDNDVDREETVSHLTVTYEDLWDESDADEGPPIETEQIARAIERWIERGEEAWRKRQEAEASRTVATFLTETETEQLGTRAGIVALRPNQFSRNLYGYRGEFPPGFPDIEECRTRCTWGAAYVRDWPGSVPSLHCLNQKHWEEKAARGLEALKEEADAAAKQEAKTDQDFAYSLQLQLSEIEPYAIRPFLRHVVLTCLWEQEDHRKAAPGDRRDTEELAYELSSSKRVRELLDLEPYEGVGYGPKMAVEFSLDKDLRSRIDALDTKTLIELAAQLVAYSRRSMARPRLRFGNYRELEGDWRADLAEDVNGDFFGA